LEKSTLDVALSEPGANSDAEDALNRRATDLLGGTLPLVLSLLCLIQFALWVPGYLTWPLWADHDVFGSAALSWSRGIKPYRVFQCNNFPGTIYLFWIVGKLFGWGRSTSFLALDAGFVVMFGILFLTWSKRCFGRAMPGLVGLATLFSYYFSLDYSQTAQRDWHGPLFAAASILIAQAWPGRHVGRSISALVFAIGFGIRPHVVLFVPAIWYSIASGTAARYEAAPDAARGAGRAMRALLEWCVICGLGLAALFAPLFVAGTFGNFLASLRQVGPGSYYSQLSPGEFIGRMVSQLLPLKIWLVPALIVFVGGRRKPEQYLSHAWLLAFACVLFYRPLNRMPHAYLAHPLALTSSVLVAVLAGRLVNWMTVPAAARLCAILLVLGLNVSLKPRFCNPTGARNAIAELRAGTLPVLAPAGYVPNPEVPASARYAWADYRAALEYLRSSTTPETPIANALKHVPALNTTLGRPTPFPAESIAWLLIMGNADEDEFAAALRRAQTAVVVWAPGERDAPGLVKIPLLTRAIETLYELDRRFGPIEVWRRKTIQSTGRDRGIPPVALDGRGN
jgi:hypothetical protein